MSQENSNQNSNQSISGKKSCCYYSIRFLLSIIFLIVLLATVMVTPIACEYIPSENTPHYIWSLTILALSTMVCLIVLCYFQQEKEKVKAENKSKKLEITKRYENNTSDKEKSLSQTIRDLDAFLKATNFKEAKGEDIQNAVKSFLEFKKECSVQETNPLPVDSGSTPSSETPA